MNDSSKYNSFTAADIERYYNGQMPAAERHALEKAALDDPFLADALEGYALTSTPVADSNAIKNRLEEKLQKKKVVPVFFKNYKWLQIAALFLILAGSGWFLYKADLFNKKEIAVATPAKTESPESFSKTGSSDSLHSANKTSIETISSEADQIQKTVANSKKSKPVNQQAQKEADEEKQRTETANVAEITRQQEEADETRSLARRMITNKEGAAQSTIPERNRNATFYNKARAADENTDSVSGYIALQKKAPDNQVSNDTIKNINVIMQPSNAMNEVVVVGLGGKAKASARPVAKFEELEPAEGWTNFNEYITQNLKQPEELKEKSMTGDVELSFEIDKEGQAVNIKVEKSLCGVCDKEAVRLLKEGPKWKQKKASKGTIIIHF
jgi:hypothetical protein